jgi:hypothetical protein
MDEAGVVKQTTIEQVIQNHQLSTKSTVLSKKERFPGSLEILPLRFSQGDGFAKPTVNKFTTGQRLQPHIHLYSKRNRSLQKERFPSQHPGTKFPLL